MPNKEKTHLYDVEPIVPKPGAWRTYDATDGLPSGVAALLQDSHGYLWMETHAGLCRYNGIEFTTYTTEDGLGDNYVTALCEDRQGRLWMGTDNGGISCYDGTKFTTYTTTGGLVSNRIRHDSICIDHRGDLWVGTYGGVSRFDGRTFTTYTTEEGLANNAVNAICEDQQGRLWFGTAGGGACCYDGVHFTTYTMADGLASDHVWYICEDRQGKLWFANGLFGEPQDGETKGGVTCFDGQNFTTYTTEDGLALHTIWTIYEDSRGDVWFGYGPKGGGLTRFDGNRFTTYTTHDGLLSNRVNGIAEDTEGHYWIGHWHTGLTRIDFETLTRLTDQPARGLTLDRRNRLWFCNDEDELCCLYEGQKRCKTFNAGRVPAFLEDASGAF